MSTTQKLEHWQQILAESLPQMDEVLLEKGTTKEIPDTLGIQTTKRKAPTEEVCQRNYQTQNIQQQQQQQQQHTPENKPNQTNIIENPNKRRNTEEASKRRKDKKNEKRREKYKQKDIHNISASSTSP